MAKKRHPLLIAFFVVAGTAFFVVLLVWGFKVLSGEEDLFSRKSKIGVLMIQGGISDSISIIHDIKWFRDNNSIKAIIIRIDSPGGGVAASQEIFREIKRTAKKKVVIASLGGVAASGGYYVAIGCRKIIASPGTITGSIGVIAKFSNVEELLKKIGIGLVTIKSGKFKDIGSPERPMTDEERALIQRVIDNLHQQFIRAVAKSRNIPVEKVAQLADGRIFSGEQAKKLGLVDKLGNLEDAIIEAKRLARITGDVELVYRPRKEFSIKDLLTKSLYKGILKIISDEASPQFSYY